MNGKRIIALSALVLGALMVFSTWNHADAQQRGRGIQMFGPSIERGPNAPDRPGRAGRGMGEFGVANPLQKLLETADRLDLTEDQIEALEALVGTAEAEIEAARAAKDALRETAMADEPVEEEIRAAADALGTAIGDLAVKIVLIKGEVEAILTDEQLELIMQYREQRMDRIEQFRDRIRSAFGRGDRGE